MTGIRPLVGATVTVQPGGRLVLLVRDAAGWPTLCRLLSSANLAGAKEQPHLTLPTLALHTTGLLALVGPDSLTAARLQGGDEPGAAPPDTAWMRYAHREACPRSPGRCGVTVSRSGVGAPGAGREGGRVGGAARRCTGRRRQPPSGGRG